MYNGFGSGLIHIYQMNDMNTKAYLVGAGIASLASAVYLIMDSEIPPGNICILEESGEVGGSMDAHGSADRGYTMRGGRMFDEEAYTCTYDLLSRIPGARDPSKTVKDEMFDFNEGIQSHSNCRLVEAGKRVDVSSMGFSVRDRIDLIRLMVSSEESLGVSAIRDHFEPTFFTTNFWFMWCTTFAFQSWHSAVEFKRYLLRFIQEFPRISTLAGVRRTPYNQYDSIIAPLVAWLKEKGVLFLLNARVTNLLFSTHTTNKRVERIVYTHKGKRSEIAVGEYDLVLITLGSMTEGSSFGSMSAAPLLNSKSDGGAWSLWETIAQNRTEFGRPKTFDDHIPESLWESFTITFHDPTFFSLMEEFTGNIAGTGGLVTFKDSNWLVSLVLPAQPHFIDQPANVQVCWGYGLFPDKPGNFVSKKMSECTGEEVLIEVLGHLRFENNQHTILRTAICIPCMLPFITSQFLVRSKIDRPPVIPKDSKNLAFIGQFCEIADDTVFTVEYSIRSAQTAVFSLLQLDKKASPIYKGQHDSRVLFDSVKALLS